MPIEEKIWLTLLSGLHSLSENDRGRPWPNPSRRALKRLLSEHPADLCLRAARETKEIVQSQDRAPNITGLFEKKLRELAEVRSEVRESVAEAAQ